MHIANLEYTLLNGYVDNWLVAGPQATPVNDLERFSGAHFKSQIAEAYYQKDSAIAEPPAEAKSFQLARIEAKTAASESFTWRAVQCQEDHFVDLSRFYHTTHHLQSWAYSELHAPQAGPTNLALTTNGPADVWVNGEHVHRQLHFHHQFPKSVDFAAQLKAGKNEILVRFAAVAVRECPYVMALQIRQPAMATAWPVTLPTTLRMPRRVHLMQCFAAAYLDQDVYHRDDDVIVRWPADYPHRLPITVRLLRNIASNVGDVAYGALWARSLARR